MSIPTAVFLDTSILDGQQYNFESTALSTFGPVCKERGLTLLLPEPTEKEIERQHEVIKEAEERVKKARRDYIDAAQDLKMMEKHKELWEKKLQKQLNFKEQKELNELGNVVFQIRRMGG